MNIQTVLKWVLMLWSALIGAVYAWHLLALEKYHWLSEGQLEQIRILLAFTIIGYVGYLFIKLAKGEY